MRALRPGKAGFDAAHVEFQGFTEDRLLAWHTPQSLLFAVGLDQFDRSLGPSGQTQIIQGDLIDREKPAGGAILRCHVGNGGAVSQWQIRQAVAEKLDELADNALAAQHLRHRQHQVGGGDAFFQFAAEFKTHHFRDQHRHWLAEHRGFGFNAAHAPAQDTQAINHGGVGVGTDQCVGERVSTAVFVLGPDCPSQVFQVDLMADSGAGRHDAEVVKGILAPAQERITFTVAFHLNINVLFKGVRAGEFVDHYRVVDHQVYRGQRIDSLRIAAGLGHRRTHGGQIDHGRYAGKVLHQYPGRAVLDFPVAAPFLEPGGQRLEVRRGDGLAVFPAQQVFQQYFERHGQPA